MIKTVFKKVFYNLNYILLSTLTTTAVFAFSVWLPNWKLILTVITSPYVSFKESIAVIFGLFLSITTNFTVLSASYTIIIAILFGINISLLIYYVSSRKGSFKDRGSMFGIGGLISGIFGIGCVACGTFVLTSVLALFGAVGIISFLPFSGGEFGILGVVLIGYATYWTAKKIEEPLVCEKPIVKINKD